MQECTTPDRATGRRIAAAAAAVALAAGPAAALPTRHHPWIGGQPPAPWPMQVVEVMDGSATLGDAWSAERTFADGTVVRLTVLESRRAWTARTIEFTLPDGRRLGPVLIDPDASSWYSDIAMGNLDEDADPEFVLIRDTGGNGSVIPMCVEILDPIGDPTEASRPLRVQRIRGLGSSLADVIDLDGDGWPEILLADMVTATADQTFEGRRRSYVALRPFRLEDGVLRDVSAEDLGPVSPWPYVIRYAARPLSERTTEIRPEAMGDVLASGRFGGTPQPAPPAGASTSTPSPARRLDAVFAALDVRGSIIILPASAEPSFGGWEHDPVENDRRSPPAGTLAPLLAAIALDVGAIEDLGERFAWDGTDHGRPEWNRDLTVREAAEVSADWVFHLIAERIPWTTAALLARDGFGDGPRRPSEKAAADSRGSQLDDGRLVSPREQVAVVQRRLSSGDVAMPATHGDGWTMRSATGRTPAGAGPADGWHVGWIQRAGGERVCFATRIRLDGDETGSSRTPEAVTLACLRAVGVLPAR